MPYKKGFNRPRAGTGPIVVPGSLTDNTPGTRNWSVQPYNTLVIEMWGGGAGGAGLSGTAVQGVAGVASSIATLGLTAGGGQTQGSTNVGGSGGGGGTASGGDVNTSGSPGVEGSTSNGGGAKGGGGAGALPEGGAGGAGWNDNNGINNGNPGTAPGGGGSGVRNIAAQNELWRRTPGGGGGSYCKKTYTFGVTPGAPSAGANLSYTVAATAAGGNGTSLDGGTGASGRVRFTWS